MQTETTTQAAAELAPPRVARQGTPPGSSTNVPVLPTRPRVLVLNQFFYPDLAATAQMATELAEDLVPHGFEVTALAGSGAYLGGERFAREARHRGVQIRRVSTTSLGKRRLVHRAADYASFYVAATVELLRVARPDVVIAMTTPPAIAGAVLPLKLLRGTRLVYWIQDLYPDIAVALGALRAGSLIARGMARVSREIVRRSDDIVTVGHEMRERVIAIGARAERVHVIGNWCDGETVRPVPHEVNPLRAELCRSGERCVVMYSGNMGSAHDMTTLIAAARLLRDRRDIRFVFQGDGSRRGEVEAAAQTCANIVLGPYQPRAQLAQSLSAADIHLASMAPGTTGLMEPSKTYGIMAAGRPTIFVGDPEADVARALVQHRCGILVPRGRPKAVADAIVRLAEDDAERTAMGARAREALERHHSRRVATRAFAELLKRSCASRY